MTDLERELADVGLDAEEAREQLAKSSHLHNQRIQVRVLQMKLWVRGPTLAQDPSQRRSALLDMRSGIRSSHTK